MTHCLQEQQTHSISFSFNVMANVDVDQSLNPTTQRALQVVASGTRHTTNLPSCKGNHHCSTEATHKVKEELGLLHRQHKHDLHTQRACKHTTCAVWTGCSPAALFKPGHAHAHILTYVCVPTHTGCHNCHTRVHMPYTHTPHMYTPRTHTDTHSSTHTTHVYTTHTHTDTHSSALTCSSVCATTEITHLPLVIFQ